MSKTYLRIFISALIIMFFQGIGNAVSSEYKNYLERIELQKNAENNYTINLYMQKSYNSPVKVIKKNDLTYYILLPETKNTFSSSGIKTQEIQSITTNLFPYAGVDVNNGYTKININTTRAINFNLNVLSLTKTPLENTQAKAIQKKKETEPQKEEPKISKKEAITPKNEIKEVPKKQINETKQSNAISKDKPKQISTKPELKSQITVVPIKKKKTITQNIVQTKTENKIQKTENSTPKPIVAKSKGNDEYIQKNTEVKKEPIIIKEAPALRNNVIENEKNAEDILTDFDNNYTEENKITEQDNTLSTENDLIADNNLSKDNYAYAAKIPLDSSDTLKEEGSPILLKLKSIFHALKDNMYEILVMLAILILAPAIILFIMFNNKQSGIKLKRKSDLFQGINKPSIVPKKEPKKDKAKNNGQYFVFDNNIKQSSLVNPSDSENKKNYELSTYDPDLNKNYSYNKGTDNEGESEYDIIQKILKEDTFIDIEQPQQEVLTKEKIQLEEYSTKEEDVEKLQNVNNATLPITSVPPQKQPETQDDTEISPETKTNDEFETEEGLTVLSKAEIAPERGFMCVRYENSTSLIGYIFDDIFVLHNFNQSELSNYDIQYRLSEKDGNDSLYIVKIAEEKMIIKVSNKNMKLEITL